MDDAIIMFLPSILVLCIVAFSLSLKSSIEQALLYFTARQALGEVTAEEAGLPIRQDAEANPHGLWLTFKTYAPACAILLWMGFLHLQKFPMMSASINKGEIYTVKALQATGVPLPFWSLPGVPPNGIRRRLRRALLPFGQHRFQPYGPDIIQSYAMTKFLIEKDFGLNIQLVVNRPWTPPGIGMEVTMTPLHLALTNGLAETAQLMIAHGANVRVLDSIGRSPLFVAITYCPSAIEPLLASGVDINEQTRFGPPLLAAARYQWLYGGRRRWQESENAVKILLEKGADPNTLDKDGRNALMVMSMESRPVLMSVQGRIMGNRMLARPTTLPLPPPPPRPGEISALPPERGVPGGVPGGAPGPDREREIASQFIGEALLQAGCKVNAADTNGRTPLMYAARYNRPTAVQLLLAAGADIKARDKDGMTAMDLANKFAGDKVIRLLRSASVKPEAAKKQSDSQ